MSSKFNDPQERFDVFEHDIVDADIQDEGYDAEAEVQIAGQGQRLSNREKRKQRRREKKARKAAQEDNYGWAFFLSSMFLGVGVTTLLDHPIGVMMGMAIGFLFFVKPFYQKVMDLIDRI